MPGVSIEGEVGEAAVGHPTSRWSISSAGTPRSTCSAPPLRSYGARGRPCDAVCTTTRGPVGAAVPGDDPGALARVVAASSSPTSALSSVDLPALTLPAMATRSGCATAAARRRAWRRPRGARRGLGRVQQHS